MPGAGKTTFGKYLAEKLHRRFIDADDFIVEMTGETIAGMFQKGEDYFRRKETEALKKLAEKEGIVIATGGGAVTKKENIEILKTTGTIIFIDRPPEDITKDVEVEKRPLLKDGPQKVYDLYEKRINLYREAADVVITNHGAECDVLEHMCDLLLGK